MAEFIGKQPSGLIDVEGKEIRFTAENIRVYGSEITITGVLFSFKDEVVPVGKAFETGPQEFRLIRRVDSTPLIGHFLRS